MPNVEEPELALAPLLARAVSVMAEVSMGGGSSAPGRASARSRDESSALDSTLPLPRERRRVARWDGIVGGGGAVDVNAWVDAAGPWFAWSLVLGSRKPSVLRSSEAR